MKKQILMSGGHSGRSPRYLQAEQNHSAQELKTSQAAEQNFISNLIKPNTTETKMELESGWVLKRDT